MTQEHAIRLVLAYAEQVKLGSVAHFAEERDTAVMIVRQHILQPMTAARRAGQERAR
jgi:hypothetical protein